MKGEGWCSPSPHCCEANVTLSPMLVTPSKTKLRLSINAALELDRAMSPPREQTSKVPRPQTQRRLSTFVSCTPAARGLQTRTKMLAAYCFAMQTLATCPAPAHANSHTHIPSLVAEPGLGRLGAF